VIRAQRLPDVPHPEIQDDPSVVEAYLEDASGLPAGRAAGLVRVAGEPESAALIRALRERGRSLLPQAARTSVTGGAIPQGEVVVSVERMSHVGPVVRHPGGARRSVGAGVRLAELQDGLAAEGLYFPPVPTYQQAMLGGTVATNAGGAATFKYGVTRQWVHGLRVLLSSGDLLVLERGEAVARRGESIRLQLSDGVEIEVEVPSYRLPDLRKISAGYHSADPLDLVDLFIGSEGTLGLITEVTLDLAPLPPSVVTGLVWMDDDSGVLALAGAMRKAATRARQAGDLRGPDVRSIEWMDRNSLQMLRDHGEARRLRIDLPDSARAGLLFELELPEGADDEEAQEVLLAFFDGAGDPADGPLTRLFRILDDHDALERLELAFPDDARRRRDLTDLREAVPLRVNEILSARRSADPAVAKVGGDLIVPFDRLGEMIEVYRRGFESRGLDYAIWGHLSDGNLHPNAVIHDAAELKAGHEALIEFAREAASRGGCPLSEHGVGRHPVKQEILLQFLGADAVAQMRRIKRTLDPDGLFAPGVIFPVG
jgi:D-lactate dehydrogenase (cytochrome)